MDLGDLIADPVLVRDRIVIIRAPLNRIQSVKQALSLTGISDRFIAAGAHTIFVLTPEINIETLSDDDLKKMNLRRSRLKVIK